MVGWSTFLRPFCLLPFFFFGFLKSERAENFKNQGNEQFKGKQYREAATFYGQGIEAGPTNPVLLEALLCNRAACNLEFRASTALWLHLSLSTFNDDFLITFHSPLRGSTLWFAQRTTD